MEKRMACNVRIFLPSLVWLHHGNRIAQKKVPISLIPVFFAPIETDNSARQRRRLPMETPTSESDTEDNKHLNATVVAEEKSI